MLNREGLDEQVIKMLGLPQGRCDLSEWSDMVERQLASNRQRMRCAGGQVCGIARRLSERGRGPLRTAVSTMALR